jgi:dihydrolipoamide dehydrogenase
MRDKTTDAPLVILGGGPGGYATAFLAAELGLQVTLVDDAPRLGGVCLHRGCIPSKALLHVAKLIREAREARALGLEFEAPRVNLQRLRAWTDGVVSGLAEGLAARMKADQIRHVQGHGRFVDRDLLEVDLAGGKRERLRFGDAVIATGSYPVRLPDQPEAPGRILDSSSALQLESVPTSLLVVGGGYIGLELGTVYAVLGAKVTVAEMTGNLLPGVDRDLVSVMKRRTGKLFEEVLLETRVTALKPRRDSVGVTLAGRRGEWHRRFERVLVAVGRRPLSKDLGLEAAGVQVDEQGFVRVDGEFRTSAAHIRAVGDVTGVPMLAHLATHQGRSVAEQLAGRATAVPPAAVPAVVYTDPEIAWCGLTQEEARASGRKANIVRTPWRASGRAATLGRDDGMTKLVVEPERGRVLGVGLVGPGAGELIAEGCLAVEMAAVAEDLRWTIHPHPTLSETIMETANALALQGRKKD